jgi:hypothetical protein
LLLQPCDGLAGEIERRIFTPNWDVCPFLPTATPDSVVLGCTHYIYIVGQIQRFYGCPVYDGNDGIARRLADVLGQNNLSAKNRDLRPLDDNLDEKVGFVTTHRGIGGKCQKLTNKRSRKMTKKSPKTEKMPPVFFLGKQREYNQKIHKQMFVWTKGD